MTPRRAAHALALARYLTCLCAGLAFLLLAPGGHVRANTAPSASQPPAAIAEFVVGTVVVQGADSQSRMIDKGSLLFSGDRILTNQGRVQLRFADGAFISLLPDTEFHIVDYRFDGNTDGSESGFYALVKGTIRMISGVIGRINRARFQISTPTATIGLRGTGGIISVDNEGATRLFGTSGVWVLSNALGSIEVGAGTSAIVTTDRGQAPRLSGEGPVTPSTTPNTTINRPAAAANGDYTGTSTTIPFTGSLPSRASNATPGVSLVINGTPATGITQEPRDDSSSPAAQARAVYAFGLVEPQGNALAVTRGIGSAQGAAIGSSGPAGTVNRVDAYALSDTPPAGVRTEGGNDGGLEWGRWTGNIAYTENGTQRLLRFGPNEGLHYVAGTPSTSIPTTNSGPLGFTSYTLSSATAPTFAGTNVSSGSLTASMGVDFTTGRLGLSLNAAFPNFNVLMSTAGGAANPAQWTTQINTSTAQFAGQFDTVQTVGNAPATICPGGCVGQFSGFFSGDAAARAGLVYRAQPVNATGESTVLQGAAVFRKAP